MGGQPRPPWGALGTAGGTTRRRGAGPLRLPSWLSTPPLGLLLGLLVGLLAAAPRASAEDESAGRLRAVADRARAAMVTVTWHPLAQPDAVERRMAVVLVAGGPLVTAGPVHHERGRWLVARADGAVAEARVLGQDAETSLTVLTSPWPDHPPIAPPSGTPASEGTAPEDLGALRGRAFVLLGADGALALGAVRQRGRRLTIDMGDRTPGRPGAELLEGAVAALPADLGGAWLDVDGRLLALQVGLVADGAPVSGERPAPVAALGLPAATAHLVAPLLVRHGRLPRAALGVWTRPTGDALNTHLGLEAGHLVVALVPDSAAARAGIEVHDVLRALEGRPFEHGATLADVLLAYRPGERVRLALLRGGEGHEATVTLDPRER